MLTAIWYFTTSRFHFVNDMFRYDPMNEIQANMGDRNVYTINAPGQKLLPSPGSDSSEDEENIPEPHSSLIWKRNAYATKVTEIETNDNSQPEVSISSGNLPDLNSKDVFQRLDSGLDNIDDYVLNLNAHAIGVFDTQEAKSLNDRLEKMGEEPPKKLIEFKPFCTRFLKCFDNNYLNNAQKMLLKFYLTHLFLMDQCKSANDAKKRLTFLIKKCHSDHSGVESSIYSCVLSIGKSSLHKLVDLCWEGTNFKSSVKVYKNGQYAIPSKSDLDFFGIEFPDVNYSSIDVLPDKNGIEKISRQLKKEYESVVMYHGILSAGSKSGNVVFTDGSDTVYDSSKLTYENESLMGENIFVVFLRANYRQVSENKIEMFPTVVLLPDNYPVKHTFEISCNHTFSRDLFDFKLTNSKSCAYEYIYDPDSGEEGGVCGIRYTSEKLRSYDLRVKDKLKCSIQ